MVQLYNMKRNTQGLLRPGLRVGTVTRLCPTLLWPCGLYNPWNSPGQNTGVGSLFLLQGIFLTQESSWSLCIAGRFFTSWATRELVHYYFLLFCWPKQVTEPNPTSVVPLETYGLGREYFWTMIQSITKGFLCYSSSKYSFYSLPGNFVCYSIV